MGASFGRGGKIMTPIIEVKKETLEYLQNTGLGQIMRDWRAWLDDWSTDYKKEIFDNLNNVMYDTSASDAIEFYVSGAYKFIVAEKEYQIVLSDVYRSGSGARWSYMFVGLTSDNMPMINYTDNKAHIYTFPKSKLNYFPKWAQELAKEID